MAECKQVERSIITTYRGKIWSKFVKAIKEYKLVEPNDHIAVCISGGKDSMLMAKLFQELKRHSDFEFRVSFLVMDPGYNELNRKTIEENLEKLQVPATIRETNIFDVANVQEKSPCYLCARMRRGALYALAGEMGCNKIALGHHYDDVIETILMSIFHSGSFQTMLPKLRSQNFAGMELIRPLYLIREQDIVNWQKANGLTFIRCACRFTENIASQELTTDSQRYNTKQLIKELSKSNPFIEKNIFASAFNVYLDKICGYKMKDTRYGFNDLYERGKNEE